ncbi:MAG: protein translocase SEC61 complex subunit gamma [Candidatus Bathyarchaeota archaeon]|nr:MAG: protein translocase SEC61 complex subunit gamma [Candidatus Bathyarchaeota archaeon]
MGLRSFLQSSARMLKLATKPGRSELWLSVKICFLGTAAVGAIGFLIHLVAVMLGE